MKTRAITGFFFVLVLLGAVLFGAGTFLVFFLVLSIFSLIEFYKVVRSSEVKPFKEGGLLLGIVLYAAVSSHLLWKVDLAPRLIVAIPLTFLICLVELYRKGNNKPFHNVAYTFYGIIMVVLPFIFYTALAFTGGEYNPHLSMGFLLLLWASDTGAYLTGRSLGKNKLFERHSPKKTWEGLFGGLFFCLLAAFLLGIQFKELSLYTWAAMSVIIVFCGTCGDLFESMLKRSMNIKDSGSILPGHGGLLDRFDGLLMSAPLVYMLLYYINL